MLDHTGIIAAVSTALAQEKVNITNVSQTLMDQYFTMIMQLEIAPDSPSLVELQKRMKPVEDAQGLVIRIQSEAIFNAMHHL